MQTQWSKMKKRLEDSICDKLKGRVEYFATSYRHAHDGQGRVCILVDKKEIINMPFSNNGEINQEIINLHEKANKPYKEIYKEACNNKALEGVFSTWIFAYAYDEFCVKTIEECLNSDNLLVKLIAFIDKRTGYRTLIKFKNRIVELPEWLQYFYNLRLQTYKMQNKKTAI